MLYTIHIKAECWYISQDAIEKQSFFPGFPKQICRGDVKTALKNADHVLTGEARMGGQEHFYLETNCTIAVPKGEDDEMEVFCSTQNPTETQVCFLFVNLYIQNFLIAQRKQLNGICPDYLNFLRILLEKLS